MFIYVDKDNNIKAINNSNDNTLKCIEINRDEVFPKFTDFMILNYKYIEEENGYTICPATNYAKLVEQDYKYKVDMLIESQAKQDEEIQMTQTAVDFILMSNESGNVLNKLNLGGSNMGAYFASRIMKKALKYEDVIRKYPEFKEDIDFILRSEGRGDLIIEIA